MFIIKTSLQWSGSSAYISKNQTFYFQYSNIHTLLPLTDLVLTPQICF
uniref:Uncharacterized protein n=1 Tax=Mastacembelus armatus TaxID=205130 RepID=A0A7N8YGT0_9TELE